MAVIILLIIVIALQLKIPHNQKPLNESGSHTWVEWLVNAVGWILIAGVVWLGVLGYQRWFK